MPEEAPVIKIFVIGYFTQFAGGNSPGRFCHKQKTRDRARAFETTKSVTYFAAAAFLISSLAGAEADETVGADAADTFRVARAWPTS